MGISLTYKLPFVNKRLRCCKKDCLVLFPWWLWESQWVTRQCWLGPVNDCAWCASVLGQQANYLSWYNEQIYPLKGPSSKKEPPWINCSILNTIKRRNIVLKAYKHTGSPFKLSQFTHDRNQTFSARRKPKLTFLDQFQSVDMKTFWKLFKLLSRKESPIPVLLISNNDVVTDDAQKAGILNNQLLTTFLA